MRFKLKVNIQSLAGLECLWDNCSQCKNWAFPAAAGKRNKNQRLTADRVLGKSSAAPGSQLPGKSST